ncbi:hypothetical protein Slin15195_G052870 [Septoria linicola]|uniref:Uncharacterized protein n=1 Tax=Septoria linicola TaxID=215465 RepID=A0A9Q9ARQ6_9PEZI|nr:hypothetical protein Slin14017_G123660 [Septoria linicola]USW51968.1 hypothetical protein Slin15195_G052870 [Septoria linicola]
MAVDMAAFPSAPDHRFSQMTPKDVKRRTGRYTQEDAAKLIRPEKPRQDSAIDLCEDKRRSQVSKLSEDHRCSEISKPDESQRVSQISKMSADQRDSQISKLSNEQRQSQASKVDTVSLFSIPPKEVPKMVDTTSLFTVHPDDMAFDFEQFDFPPGPRLSRPFMMPTPIRRKRGSTMISRRSVVSVELITDFVRSRRITQDSDTLSPTCMSPTELQRLYEDCIPQHPAFFDNPVQCSIVDSPDPAIVDGVTSPKRQSIPALPLQQSKERVVSITRQSSRMHLQHKCSILSMDKAGFAERVDDAMQMLAETKERLYRAKKDLYIREEHYREIEVHATNMKVGMEQAMRNYSCTSKELASLKAFRWECSPSVPAQVLSMRQRKIHGELKMQIRDLERKLSTTMAELRCMEKKWKEAQKSLSTCTRDLEKQKCIVSDKAEELRIAEEAKASSIELLETAEQDLKTTKEQRDLAKREGAEAAERKQNSQIELTEANKKAHRLSKRLSQAEADCEESRVKIKQIKRTSSASDNILQKKLLIAKRELRDREELLRVVKQTNADLARKIAVMEQELGGRKHLSAGEALS